MKKVVTFKKQVSRISLNLSRKFSLNMNLSKFQQEFGKEVCDKRDEILKKLNKNIENKMKISF